MSLRQEQEEEADVKGHTESIKPFNKAVGAGMDTLNVEYYYKATTVI